MKPTYLLLVQFGVIGLAILTISLQENRIDRYENILANIQIKSIHDAAIEFAESHTEEVTGVYTEGTGYATIKLKGRSYPQVMETCNHEYFHYLDDTKYINEDHWR